MSWQKPARIGVAIVGLASVAAVYLMMGERSSPPPPQPIEKSDKKAIVEFKGSLIDQFIGARKNFEIGGIDVTTSYYADGTKKLTGNPLVFTVYKGESRSVRIEGREAKVSQDENSFELLGPVKLHDSDGFWLETDRATVNRVDSIAHIPGAATFGKGRMTGSGTGLSYDEMHEVLLIAQQTRVKTVDASGKSVMEMASGSGMLDRAQHFLALDSNVHVVRNDETIDTDLANGRLSVNNDVVTYVELHGNARVVGGTSIDAMSARDIALDYTADGQALESVKMAGAASVAMTGADGKPGRRIAGEKTLDLALAPDGTLTSAVARQNVRLELPPGTDAPGRTITAQALDGTGEPGKGLTHATFSEDVTYTEQDLASKATPADKKAWQRTAQAQKLEASLVNDAVETAVFSGGDVTFEETGLKGCAERVEYRPGKNSLRLSGATKGGNPMVADEQVAIEAEAIDVTLDTRRMNARTGVQMFMHMPEMRRCRPAAERPKGDQGTNTVPGLFKADAPIRVSASSLDYDSRTGRATYTGSPASRVALAQEETSIGAETVVIDQTRGDLTATGMAVSNLLLDNKRTTGRAHEIRYSDQRRRITYASMPQARSGEVSLTSPDSSLAAGRIDITLTAKENLLEHMTAERNVRLMDSLHVVRGGSRLDYSAKNALYIVTGDGTTPVIVISKEGDQCRQSSGNYIEFGKDSSGFSISAETRQAMTEPSTSACTPSTR